MQGARGAVEVDRGEAGADREADHEAEEEASRMGLCGVYAEEEARRRRKGGNGSTFDYATCSRRPCDSRSRQNGERRNHPPLSARSLFMSLLGT